MNVEYTNSVAYFHWQPIWFGSQPENFSNRDELREIVYASKLSNGINIKFQRQGIVIFEFFEDSDDGYIASSSDLPSSNRLRELNQIVQWRVKLINVHLVCMYSALGANEGRFLRKLIINSHHLLRYNSENNQMDGTHHNQSLVSMSYMEPSKPPAGFEWWSENRETIIEQNVIALSIEKLNQVIKHSQSDALELVHLYGKSCALYEEHDYNWCLMTAWAVIEKLIQVFWEGYIEFNRKRDGKTFINKKRKDNLLNGDRYSISVIIEILSLANAMSLSLYDEINLIRDARNKWIHRLKFVSEDKARIAVTLADDLLRWLFGISRGRHGM